LPYRLCPGWFIFIQIQKAMWQFLKTPDWQKDLHRKEIGLRRTKSFLKDSFWILEQTLSNKVTAFDFIIQRRITLSNLLDKNPPCFGIVKSLYYTNESDTFHIAKTYITDGDNEPRNDFFVIAHADNNNASEIYFLTAPLIVELFDMDPINGTEYFSVPGTTLLQNDKFIVSSQKNALAKMELQLEEADFIKNRLFFAQTLPDKN
jgi:hypothetical protein